MFDVAALKETLSKIETLAEAALYLTANDDERHVQLQLIELIEEIACCASQPCQVTPVMEK